MMNDEPEPNLKSACAPGFFHSWKGVGPCALLTAITDFGLSTWSRIPFRFVEIAHSGKPQTAILCVPNQGAIPTLEDTDVVEVTCDVTADSCTPHHVALEDIPAGNLELIRRVKYYERTAARGIVNRSRKDLVDAITLHPLVQSYSIAQELVDQYIELNRDYIDGWK